MCDIFWGKYLLFFDKLVRIRSVIQNYSCPRSYIGTYVIRPKDFSVCWENMGRILADLDSDQDFSQSDTYCATQ